MNIWWTILLAGLGSLALRLSFVLGGRYLRLPAWTGRVTNLVFPVAIGAILGVSLRHSTAGAPTGGVVALAAGAALTALVSRRTGSVLFGLLAGLAVVVAGSLLT
jgi:branched-subunit amino acid transport protein